MTDIDPTGDVAAAAEVARIREEQKNNPAKTAADNKPNIQRVIEAYNKAAEANKPST